MAIKKFTDDTRLHFVFVCPGLLPFSTLARESEGVSTRVGLRESEGASTKEVRVRALTISRA